MRARAAGASVIIEVADDGAGIDRVAVHRAAVAAGLVPADAPSPGNRTPRRRRVRRCRRARPHLRAGAVDPHDGQRELRPRRRPRRRARHGRGARRADRRHQRRPAAGTRFVLTLPVSLGILRCLLCRVGGERYAIPLPSVSETCSLRGGAAAEVSHFAGSDLLIRDGSAIPLLDLAEILGSFTGSRARRAARKPSAALLTSTAGRRPLAWAVDGLEGEADLVVTDLGPFLSGAARADRHGGGGVAGASGLAAAVTGASILDDGSVVCLLDLRALGSAVGVTAGCGAAGSRRPATWSAGRRLPTAEPEQPPRACASSSSRTRSGVRELERSLLASAGYAVDTAVDGVDGVAHLTGEPYDLIVTDIEMPGHGRARAHPHRARHARLAGRPRRRDDQP